MLTFLLLTAIAPAYAQLPGANGKSGQPFTIDADDSLEYRQAEKIYVAKGRAKVTREGASVTADTLTAYERDKVADKNGNKIKSSANPIGGGGSSEIWKFEADGNVVVDNGNAAKPSIAYGDHATYDIDSQRAVLTGKNLHLDSGADRITARDSFEYLTDKKEAIATGDAKAVQTPTAANPNTRTVTADTLHVFFMQDRAANAKDNSGLAADHIEARGHVRVTTETVNGAEKQTSTATSEQATFDNKGNKATLMGNVKIARGPNQLEGERAEVDMNTGVSRLLAAPAAANGKKPRVRGLLVPGSGVVTQ